MHGQFYCNLAHEFRHLQVSPFVCVNTSITAIIFVEATRLIFINEVESKYLQSQTILYYHTFLNRAVDESGEKKSL